MPPAPPTSPPSPELIVRKKPLRWTSSPGLYIWRSSTTYHASWLSGLRLIHVGYSPHHPASSVTNAESSPLVASRNPEPLSCFSDRPIDAMPLSSVLAVMPHGWTASDTPSI